MKVEIFQIMNRNLGNSSPKTHLISEIETTTQSLRGINTKSTISDSRLKANIRPYSITIWPSPTNGRDTSIPRQIRVTHIWTRLSWLDIIIISRLDNWRRPGGVYGNIMVLQWHLWQPPLKSGTSSIYTLVLPNAKKCIIHIFKNETCTEYRQLVLQPSMMKREKFDPLFILT